MLKLEKILYNKLVRDKIITILRHKDKVFSFHVAKNDAEYKQRLADKLVEEAQEFKADPTLEELADLQEVLFAALKAYGYTKKSLTQAMREKGFARGKFEKRFILEWVKEK